MNYLTQDRALLASTGLMWLAIGFGCLSFWEAPLVAAITDGGIVEHVADWLVASMLTAALIFASLLLSGVVTRFAESKEKGLRLTAGLVVALGAILCAIEAAMTHQGLAWLDSRKDIAQDWALWVASFGLSIFNVFSLYTFARDLKKKESPATAAGRLLVELREQKKRAA